MFLPLKTLVDADGQMLRPYTYAYLFTNVVTDILLTLSIAIGLWKSKTGWKHTDNVIKRIIV